MPRLSVYIDLTYLPFDDREEVLTNISNAPGKILTPTIKIKWSCKSNIYKVIFISSTKSSTKILIHKNVSLS